MPLGGFASRNLAKASTVRVDSDDTGTNVQEEGVDEPDTALRDLLLKDLKNEMAAFLARGGILITLSRLALKRSQPTQRFTLDNGILRKGDQIAGVKIVGLNELRTTQNQGSVMA